MSAVSEAQIAAATEAIQRVLDAALRGPGAGRFDARELAVAALEASICSYCATTLGPCRVCGAGLPTPPFRPVGVTNAD